MQAFSYKTFSNPHARICKIQHNRGVEIHLRWRAAQQHIKPFFMEKIIFVTNGHLLNTQSVDFACYLAQRTHSGLTGMFLEEDKLELVPPFESELSYFKKTTERPANTDVIMDVDQRMRYFLQECQTKSIRADVYHHVGNAVDDIVHESRFADLLVLDPQMIFNPLYKQVPPPEIKEALEKVESPIVVAPMLFEDVDNIVFCYDGSRSSVFAMKQFTYLFPQFAEKKVTVLEVEKQKRMLMKKKN